MKDRKINCLLSVLTDLNQDLALGEGRYERARCPRQTPQLPPAAHRPQPRGLDDCLPRWLKHIKHLFFVYEQFF